MINENELRINGKIKFFLVEKCHVHVKRMDKTFWNGYVVNEKADGVFVFQEDKLGEKLLFVSDIYEIDLYEGGRD